MVNFTQNDILLYINNELSTEQATSMELALQNDTALKNEYDLLVESKISLDQPLLKPRRAVINRILAYAQNSVPVRAAQA
jgi:hypothetical protein